MNFLSNFTFTRRKWLLAKLWSDIKILSDCRFVELDSLSILRLWDTVFFCKFSSNRSNQYVFSHINDGRIVYLRISTPEKMISCCEETRVTVWRAHAYAWPLGATRSRRSYPIPVQRQHLSRDMDVLRANQGWLDMLSFFSPRNYDSIRFDGDNDSRIGRTRFYR